MNKKFGIRSYVRGRIFPIVPKRFDRARARARTKLSMEHARLAAMDAGARPNESPVGFTRSILLYGVRI